MPRPYLLKRIETVDFYCASYRRLIKLAYIQTAIIIALIGWFGYAYFFPKPDSYYATTALGETIAITPKLIIP